MNTGVGLEEALSDATLQATLQTFQHRWRASRDAAMSEVDFDGLKARLKAAKRAVLDDMDASVAGFAVSARAAGATVHEAATAEEAVRYMVELARDRGLKIAIKSKSMVSEEIGLGAALEEAGVEVIETDLGEWIIQLAGQRPSHMVLPAIHKNRSQVLTLLRRADPSLSEEATIEEMVRAARRYMRSRFLAADVGITGANAAIVEDGRVMMVTNEGNGRLTTTQPELQVTFVGVEKLIPTIGDAMTQLRLLARSATAQQMTSYVTFFRGDDPGRELHIVLVDNGRRRLRARPEKEEALQCIRCGACANVCPAFGVVGGHVFGHIYTGPIGLVVSPELNGLETVAAAQSLCLSCNACATVCPVDIPLPAQILEVRRDVVAAAGLRWYKAAAFWVLRRPTVFRLGARSAGLAAPLLRILEGSLGRLPGIRAQTSWRRLPLPAARPLPGRWRRLQREFALRQPQPGRPIGYFAGCITETVHPESGTAVAGLLFRLGYQPALLGQHCCGLPASNSGDWETARTLARQTIRAIEATAVDEIVSAANSCVAAVAADYQAIFRDDPEWQRRAAMAAARMVDMTSFLARPANLEKLRLLTATAPPLRVTYHDSCQSLTALGLKTQGRRILAATGCELVEMPTCEECCGFGGSFTFEHPEVAQRLAAHKLVAAADTGADVLVTDNSGCVMHLDAASRIAGTLRTLHLVELVTARLGDSPSLVARGSG
jgi:iron-sulfur cluster protein